MRLVVQRVEKAKVISEESGKILGEIGIGLLVLVGIKKGDSEKEVEILTQKLSKLRVMNDKAGKMNLSVSDVGGSMLVVSQFTLHADTSGGNRPSFINAEEPEKAKKLYELFIEKLKENGVAVETGRFGNYMKIEAVLNGPVTILYNDF
jgi:D-tyrosyl-tRNA(Tyr) deacylase